MWLSGHITAVIKELFTHLTSAVIQPDQGVIQFTGHNIHRAIAIHIAQGDGVTD